MDVIQRLRSLGLNDHEAILAVQSAVPASGRRGQAARSVEILSQSQVVATVSLNAKLMIKSFEVQDDIAERVLQQIEADESARSDIAPVALFSQRPIAGFAKVDGWIRLRPAGPVRNMTGLPDSQLRLSGAPSAIVLETAIRTSKLSLLAGYRRMRDVQEAVWLVTAFLDTPVFMIRAPFVHAQIAGEAVVALIGVPAVPAGPKDGRSELVDLPELVPVPTEDYYSRLGIGESTLRVPDLADLYRRYLGLNPDQRIRYLRACAWLSEAAGPELDGSQRVVMLISAIEALLPDGEKCDVCRSHLGIAKGFRQFIHEFVKPAAEIERLFEGLYVARSRLAHGRWHYAVDEPTLGSIDMNWTTSLAAWSAAKRGIVNWLLSQPPLAHLSPPLKES